MTESGTLAEIASNILWLCLTDSYSRKLSFLSVGLIRRESTHKRHLRTA
jgi:hypothetical protein